MIKNVMISKTDWGIGAIMKNIGKILLVIGVLVYVLYSVVNRFFFEIPDIAAYIIMVVGLVCILVGFLAMRK